MPNLYLVLLPLEEEILQKKLYEKVEERDTVYLLQLEGLISLSWQRSGEATYRGEVDRTSRPPSVLVSAGDQDTQVTAALRQKLPNIEVKRFGVEGKEYQTPVIGFDFFSHTKTSYDLARIVSKAKSEREEPVLLSNLSGLVLDYIQSLLAGKSAVEWWRNHQNVERE